MTPERTRRRSRLAYVVLAAALGVGGLEVMARVLEVFVPAIPVDETLGFDARTRLFVPSASDPDVLVTNPAKRSSFLEQSFRRDKPRGTYRVFCMGGSSVHQAAQDLDTLGERLAEALGRDGARVEVIDAGGLSYGSHRLALVVRELVEYEPDLVLLYTGHNEFEEVEQLEFARPSLRLLAVLRVARRSAAFRVLRDLATRLRRRHLEELAAARDLAASQPDSFPAWTYPFTKADASRRMEAFHRNLDSIVDRCQSGGVQIVIGSVPSNLVKPALPDAAARRHAQVAELLGRGEYVAGARLAREILRETPGRHQSSDHENEVIRDVAESREIPLADVEAAITAREPHGVLGEVAFGDHCHLTPDARVVWRLTYQQAIARLWKSDRPEAAARLLAMAEQELADLPPLRPEAP